MKIDAGRALVIEAEGAAIACLFSRPSTFQPGALSLGPLVVAPAMRGRGKTREIIAARTAQAREAGFAGLDVAIGNAEAGLAGFYEPLGFRGFRDGTGCLAMDRPISG